jgi:hypothetical protein
MSPAPPIKSWSKIDSIRAICRHRRAVGNRFFSWIVRPIGPRSPDSHPFFKIAPGSRGRITEDARRNETGAAPAQDLHCPFHARVDEEDGHHAPNDEGRLAAAHS